MGVRVQILLAEVPRTLEIGLHEERCRDRQAAAECLADAEDVCNVGAGPHLSDAAEAGEDRVHDEQCANFVAAPAQRRQEVVRRHTRTRPSLHGLDDDDSGVFGKRARILTVCTSMHRSW